MLVVKDVGNIGAHPEVGVLADINVTAEEAEQLLIVIEMLFKSLYIDKKDQEGFLSRVKNIGLNKKDLKEKAKIEIKV